MPGIIFKQILTMFALICVGYALMKSGKITNEGSKSIGQILIYVSLPSVIINGFMVDRNSETIRGLLIASLVSIIVVLISIVIAHLIFKKDEIADFAKVVEDFTGNKVTPEKLAEAIKICNEKRKAMQRVYDCRKSKCLPISGRDALLMTQISFFDDPVRCAQMCNRLADELEQRIKDGVSVVPEGTKRILITGTPLAVPNWKLHNIIETSGAAVVCEEMCTGTRYFENLVDESGETLDEQFMNLSRRYMKTNCACFTPNTGRIDDILRMVDEYQVDGVIDCSLMFCCLYDTEKRAVAEALKEKNIPVLSLETDYTDTDAEQLRTRIGAFVEMLSK